MKPRFTPDRGAYLLVLFVLAITSGRVQTRLLITLKEDFCQLQIASQKTSNHTVLPYLSRVGRRVADK